MKAAPIDGAVVPEADPELDLALPLTEVEERLKSLPPVRLRQDLVPEKVSPARFFRIMLDVLMDNTPVNFHEEARKLRTRGERSDETPPH